MNEPAARVIDNGKTIINITSQGLSSVAKGMHLNEIRTAIPELEAACNHAIEAAEDYDNVCKLIALKAGTDAAVVKTFITARCKENVAKTENKAEQLSILFNEIT